MGITNTGSVTAPYVSISLYNATSPLRDDVMFVDNYISLLPGETRLVGAVLKRSDYLKGDVEVVLDLLPPL